MDILKQYAELVKQILEKDAKIQPSHGEIEPHLVFDDERYSYQLMYIGWDGHRRVHSPLIHIRLQHGKIYIEEDGTEEGIANVFLERGVPKKDIVLAFYSQKKRQFTDFAVA